jgi:F-type H+-transporting ATPase subunit a
LGLLFIPFTYWVIPSRWALLWNKVIEAIHREFKALLSPGQVKVTLLFTSLFSFILFNNFLGLMPYIFTSTSHLSMTLSLSLPLWISFILFGWINHTQHIFAHLVPQGTPGLLIPFIVLIETIRNVIRPGTLAVRLAANIIAGHLLLTLLESRADGLPLTILVILIGAQILLLILESAVAIIQSYVFAVLRTLYASEVN